MVVSTSFSDNKEVEGSGLMIAIGRHDREKFR